jgi:cobalt/nickel transport system permease protein
MSSHIRADSTGSWLDNVDPRARICGACMFALVVVLSDQTQALLVAFIFSITMAYVAKLEFSQVLRKLAMLDLFMLYLLLFLPFTVTGELFFEWQGYKASWQGLERAVQIALKANAVVIMLFALVSSLSNSALGSALQALRVSNKLIQLLLFTLRYLTVIYQEYQRLRLSMRARAFVMKCNWHTWKTMGNLIGMMLVRSIARAERIVKAMKCRGYNGEFISSYEFKWQKKDAYFGVYMLTAMLLVVCINYRENWF